MKKARAVLRSTRLWGLLGTALALYVVVFVIFGRTDVSGIMPDTNRMARNLIAVWPKMPFFVQKEQTNQGQVVYYTVSTHQFTPQELRALGATNIPSAHAAKPR